MMINIYTISDVAWVASYKNHTCVYICYMRIVYVGHTTHIELCLIVCLNRRNYNI